MSEMLRVVLYSTLETGAKPTMGKFPLNHPNVGSETETTDHHERRRDFLTPREIDRLLDASKLGRHRDRDFLIVLLLYRHGLRASELCGMRRDDLSLEEARVWVSRLKNGRSTNRPLYGDELRALRRYLSSRTDTLPWLILNERGGQMTRHGVFYLIRMIAKRAGLSAHPHTLRHSCGYALADRGVDVRVLQDFLGHRNIQHTTHYTRLSARRFENLWGRK
jgi:site-specific recombinase XerD